jgi:hypothetical protein
MNLDRTIIDKVRKSNYALSIENFYQNVAYMSGWILSKPKIIKHDDSGRESASIIIAQFFRDENGFAYMKTFNLISYLPTLVAQFKELEYVTFISCVCQLQRNTKVKVLYPQVYEMILKPSLNIKLQESED